MSDIREMRIIGVSASQEGAIGKTSGKAYRIGAIHTTAHLAPPMAEGAVEKGEMGTSYSCDPEVVRRIAHLSFPLIARVEVEAQMRFGKREDTVIDVKPLEVVKKAA